MRNAKVYQIVTEQILNKLAEGVIPWRKSWASEEPKNLITKKPYRGINHLMLSMYGFSSPYYLTFNQCRKLGGQVKKGSKSILIVFWKWIELRDKEEADGEKKKVPFLRYYRVFNVEQCEGLKVPDPVKNDNPPIKAAEKIVKGYKGKPKIKHGGSSAYYKPSEDYVQVPDKEKFDDSESYYATLFHELIHSTGHESRLGRLEKGYSILDGTRNKEELVAEIGAALLCSRTGIANDQILDNAASYIDGWSKALKENPDWFVAAGGKAQKAMDHIVPDETEEKPEKKAPKKRKTSKKSK